MNGIPTDAKLPLPPVGQKGAAYFQTKLPFLVPRPSDSSPSEDSISRPSTDSGDDPPDWVQRACKPSTRGGEYWKPGYYVFMSNRYVPAEDALGNMQRTLSRQTDVWQSHLMFMQRLRDHPEDAINSVGQVDRRMKEQIARRVVEAGQMYVILLFHNTLF